jgi:putative chitinase
MPLDASLLRRIAPSFPSHPAIAARQAAIIEEVGGSLDDTLAEYGMDSPLRAAHFLAQVCEESAGFSCMEEESDGSEYEGRFDLGNIELGDGPRFKGRGLIQLTGRANYGRYASPPTLDLLEHPELAAKPAVALRLACEFWAFHGLNDFADCDDLLVISFRINGGFNGLGARRACLARAKAALGLHSPALPPRLPMRKGDAGPDVVRLQARLRRVGQGVGLDGEFGAATEACLARFQTAHGLAPDGIAGPRSWEALVAASG